MYCKDLPVTITLSYGDLISLSMLAAGSGKDMEKMATRAPDDVIRGVMVQVAADYEALAGKLRETAEAAAAKHTWQAPK